MSTKFSYYMTLNNIVMTKVFNRNFWLTLVALALSENKRNIRSFFIVLYKYTCICAYSKCEGPHLYIFWCTSLIWRRIFALSPLGREKMQIRRHQDLLQRQRISILVSHLCLCIFAFASLHVAVLSSHFCSVVFAITHFSLYNFVFLHL